MTLQIKAPTLHGANDKTFIKITSHKHCTKKVAQMKPCVPTNGVNTMTFQEFLYDCELGNHSIIFDGNIHRINPPENKSPDGWYVAHQEGDFESGAAGNWRTGFKSTFSSVDKSVFTPEQKRQYAMQMKRISGQNKLNTFRRHTKAMKEVAELWCRLSTENIENHPYLLKKQVQAHNVRLNNGDLCYPIYDSAHTLWNLQTIKSNGFKLFHKGAKIQGCYHPIGLLNCTPSRVIISEGIATGLSIYQATGIATVVCFTANNIESVSKALKRKYPNTQLIIAGDNDQFNRINIGKYKSESAAKVVQAEVALPKFKDLSTKPTDFNDLHCLEGLDTVKKQIMEVLQCL